MNSILDKLDLGALRIIVLGLVWVVFFMMLGVGQLSNRIEKLERKR